VYINHKGPDVSKWTVEQIVYNNQSFTSADDLLNAYNTKKLKVSVLPVPPKSGKLFSSYEQRGHAQPAKPSRGPELYEPDGKRYAVDNSRVEYMGWGFEFRVDSVNGIEIYDITFKGDRIVYELSLQEAIATYTGYYPSQTSNYYLDGSWSLGMFSFELVPGVDCPKTSTFFNLTHMIGTANAMTMKNSVCVFEQNTGK
jgi:diamine oxidase